MNRKFQHLAPGAHPAENLKIKIILLSFPLVFLMEMWDCEDNLNINF